MAIRKGDALISSETEYGKAREELAALTQWLAQLESNKVDERKKLTATSICKKISLIQEEIAAYEAERDSDTQ